MKALFIAKDVLKKTRWALIRNMINMPGWRTDRKLVVFESDDWGSIRMASRKVYEKLLASGDKVDADPFTRYDALASASDLFLLFEVLTGFKDCRGHCPVITANSAVANPNFEKIEASGYSEYYYEPFTETLKKYPEHEQSFSLWQQGIAQKIFFPQFHCREHLNVSRWLKHLRAGRSDVLAAFKNRMISTGNSFTPENSYAYMDALNYDGSEELTVLKTSIQEGTGLFKQIFGYYARSFIACCYIWGEEMEEVLAQNNIEYLQGHRFQLVPKATEGTKGFSKKYHYTGQMNRYKQIYLIRNCQFEPSFNQNMDWLNNCLREIDTAFKWRRPAIISTHRLNYIGYIDRGNRDRNLALLSRLLSRILQLWPEVEFITSVELGDMISGNSQAGTACI